MEIKFSKTQTKVVTHEEPVTQQELAHILEKYKPREVYHSQWSSNIPFIVITEYVEGGMIMYCNGTADKTPSSKTYGGLYDFLKYQGLSDCFFSVRLEKV